MRITGLGRLGDNRNSLIERELRDKGSSNTQVSTAAVVG
jgi:hypothetical protein